jgi:predicted amidophosphoribosyltransferase
MKCSQCGLDNEANKKFCTECGTSLSLNCPQCNAEVKETEKFCGECGRSLTVSPEPTPSELSFDEKIEKIQRYLPQGLTERKKFSKGRVLMALPFCVYFKMKSCLMIKIKNTDLRLK